MFHKNTRALAVLFMLSLFATGAFAQGGTANGSKDANQESGLVRCQHKENQES